MADYLGWTALIFASGYAGGGHVEIVRALLAAGANKHLITRSGATARSLSANYWQPEICSMLDLAP